MDKYIPAFLIAVISTMALGNTVEELLKQYDSEIEKGRLDYRRLFEMTKKKLVQERNIIL